MPRPRRNNNNSGRNSDRRRNSALARRARRDIEFSYRPLLQENERSQAAANSVYGALPPELRNIYQGYTGRSNAIAGNLTNQLGALQSALPQYDAPKGELAAFYGAYGDAGQAALGSLASQAMRNSGYGASSLAEAGYAQRAAIDNLLQQRDQIMQNFPMDIQKRIDELREMRLTHQLARSQMESEEATSKYLMDLIGAQLRSDRRRDRGNNRGHNNSNNNRPNTPNRGNNTPSETRRYP